MSAQTPVQRHQFIVLASQVIENPVTGLEAFITSFPDAKDRVNIYDLGAESFFVLTQEHLAHVKRRREVTEVEWNLLSVYADRGDRADETLLEAVAAYLEW